MKKIIGYVESVFINISSIPLRIVLSLYPQSTNTLIRLRRKSIIFKRVYQGFLDRMVEVPITVRIGKNVSFVHNSLGTIVHNSTIIGNNVKIYQNVTIGRSDVYYENSNVRSIIIGDDVILCTGCKVLANSNEELIVGKGTIVAANAVLLNSTGDNEVWGGIPAKLIGKRKVANEQQYN